jgi:hypothetical protein
MRFASALIVVIASVAGAQHRGGGGMQGGGFRPGPSSIGIGIPGRIPFVAPPVMNPFLFPTFPERLAAVVSGSPPFGASPFWGSSASFPWFPGQSIAPVYGGSGFYSDPGFAGGWNAPYSYPQQQQPNTTIVLMPPTAVAPPAPVIEEPSREQLSYRPPRMPVMAIQGPDIGDGAAPVREPAPQENYPALVAIKNGGLYTATTYWSKGDTFHFITTQRQHMQVPLTQVERVYPPQKNGRFVEPEAPRVRR